MIPNVDQAIFKPRIVNVDQSKDIIFQEKFPTLTKANVLFFS